MNRKQADQMDLEAFRDLCKKHRVHLDEDQLGQILSYRDLLVAWNDRVRLVSRSDSGRLLCRHVFESLLALRSIQPDVARIADIGSGGGFPGIPIALSNKTAKVSLIESARMKCLFLREVVERLGLRYTEVTHERVENVWETRSGTYDVVTARAVASIEHVWELAEPLLKPQGTLVALKGPGEAEEGLGPLGIPFDEQLVKLDDRMLAVVVVQKS